MHHSYKCHGLRRLDSERWSRTDVKHKATYDNHCLHHLLPVAKSNKYGLRDIGHGLLIDQVTSELHKGTFINRILFSNCY